MLDDNIQRLIKSKVDELGFIDFAFAPAQKLSKEIEIYKQWIADGKHRDMLWMENNIEKREDPNLLLDGFKSAIVLLTSYNTEFNNSDREGHGKLAKYSWGKDYHKLIKKNLKNIEKYLEAEIPSFKSRSFIDTGPVLERQWAVKAGLGWQGKNTLLLNRKLGSMFFISVIFTNLEVQEAPKIVSDKCGKCTKCIDACPTQAIEQEYTVNASKCISYWTIESKDESFPKEISDNLNGWVFGCDICQEVCPWNNHRVPITKNEYFFPRNNETEIEIVKLLDMQEDEFAIRFQNSPLKRPKINGIKRNARAVRDANK